MARGNRCCSHSGYLDLLLASSDAAMLDLGEQLSHEQDEQREVCKVSTHSKHGRKRDGWLSAWAELAETQETWLRR